MKLIVISFLLFFLQCSVAKNTNPNSNSANQDSKTETSRNKNKIENMQDKNKKSDNNLKYDIDLKVSGDMIEISYSIENTSDEDYLVFNMGDTNKGLGNRMVYVDPIDDNLVELSQKRFLMPTNGNCPDFEVPVEAGASWLKSKQTIKNTVSTKLPLKLNTPFDQCTPQPEIPKETNKIKFCLGVAKANPSKVIVKEKGYVEGWENVDEQEFLCSKDLSL